MKQILRFCLAVLLSFSLQTSFSQTDITVTITTDCWGGEVSWGIYDDANTQVAGVGSGTMGNQTTYTTDVTLADGCYEFRINDTYGDGMNGEIYGSCGVNGTYSVTDALGNIYAETTPANAAYGGGQIHCVCVPAPSGCTDPQASNYDDCAVIDDGSCVLPMGCTDPNANNYDPVALQDDGSCTYDPPVAQFSYTSDGTCVGSTFNFTNESTGGIVSYDWTFENGTPATSSDPNPVVTFNSAGTHAVSLTVTDVNSQQDLASTDISVATGNTLEVVIVQDNYPGETSWDVADVNGNVIASGNVNGGSVCIGDECHTFTIYDSYGDGICCGYGNGSYSILLNGVEVATGGAFAYEESVYVNCPPGIDCNNTLLATEGLNTVPEGEGWFSYTPPQNGQFRISTCGNTTCNTVIWMYDYCNMGNFDNTNEATLTYNDDLCGSQAEITPLLEGGFEYYIRVGSTDGSCTADFDMLIEYMGPVVGCMDPAACNYLPIAESPAQCYYVGDPECPDFGPDLEVLGDVFYNSMYLTSLTNNDACYVNEGCMQGFGDREIIRFTTHIKNIGTEDYFIGQPGVQLDQFEWDVCHNHWHYEGYAEYVLYDENGLEMPQIGFKNGFCVLDLECSDGGTAKYTCGNMGITAGCGDIYSSGLSCQWVDVTDVPAGTYTLVVRTNWDFSPDANGSYELRYDNNWAAVCISFERDANGNVINFTKDLNCPIIVDCLGQPFGNAMPDCAGNCPGVTVKGDINGTGELEVSDSDQYVLDILGNDAVVSPCTDMDNDGEITVTDAALIAGCVFFGPEHVDENGVHDHCIFEDEITNPNHNVTLSIGDINTDLGYVDVYILNPDCKVAAYEFDVSGITIQSVENIYDPLLFDATPAASLGGSKVIGYTLDDVLLPKNYTPAPFVRIYYLTAPGPDVCVSSITDVVNESYHNVVVSIGACMSITAIHTAEFSADATTICAGGSVTFTDESLNAPTEWSWNFEGGSPASSNDQNPIITYNTPGTYNVTLVAGTGGNTDTETKFDYITVLPNTVYYLDNDNDGYGDDNNTVMDCSQPAGYVEVGGDCNDNDNSMYPGATEVCDNKDNDCDGDIDEGAVDMGTVYMDADGDGYGDFGTSMLSCDVPAGWVSNSDDCDDSNPSVYPGAPGTQEGLDNDCNGIVEGEEVFVCNGDFNNDNVINIGDLLIMLSNFGCNGDCVSDMNGDNVVNTADQVMFLALYGTSCLD